MSAETDLEELCRVLRDAAGASEPYRTLVRRALDLAEGLHGRVYVDDARFMPRSGVACCACNKNRIGNAPGWTSTHVGMSIEIEGTGVSIPMNMTTTRWLCPDCAPTRV